VTIPLTPKQQATAREYQAAITDLQQRLQAYLKAVLDGSEASGDVDWTLSPDGSELVEQAKPELMRARN
jgi:hypothetical protein